MKNIFDFIENKYGVIVNVEDYDRMLEFLHDNFLPNFFVDVLDEILGVVFDSYAVDGDVVLSIADGIDNKIAIELPIPEDIPFLNELHGYLIYRISEKYSRLLDVRAVAEV